MTLNTSLSTWAYHGKLSCRGKSFWETKIKRKILNLVEFHL